MIQENSIYSRSVCFSQNTIIQAWKGRCPELAVPVAGEGFRFWTWEAYRCAVPRTSSLKRQQLRII